MGIHEEDVQRVKELAAPAIVDIVGATAALKRVGRRYSGLCPFHAEKTPSFSVNPEQGVYYCFGCQASGDVITFVRETQHLDFVEAIEWLAQKVGVQLRYDDARTGADQQKRAKLLDVMERAAAFFHERLLTSPDAGRARGYLRSRGYGPEIVRQFRIGWAPDDWDALAKHLNAPADVLRDTGLGFLNRRGKQQDTFRARIMFPILDVGGRCIAFGGRVMPGSDDPRKYVNSAETPLYSKSRTLYGLSFAKAGIVESGEVVVCEGYTDVIAFHQAGLPRAVATCGTALAEDHFRTLKNFARRIVLAYDADAAGQAAADRFYAWEQAYEVDIAVAALPAGADPADVARDDPAALAKAVAEARPFLGFRLERVLAGADLRSPEGRARAADAAMAVIGEHPNSLVRDQYVMQVADRTRIDPERLRAGAARGRPAHARERDGAPRAAPADAALSGPEIEALRLLIHRRETVEQLLRPPLADHDDSAVAHVWSALFADDHCLVGFQSLWTASTVAEAVDAAGPEVGQILRRLAVEETDAAADDVLNLLAWQATQRLVKEYQIDLRADPSKAAELVSVVAWLKDVGERLHPDREQDARTPAFNELVAWLVRWGEESDHG